MLIFFTEVPLFYISFYRTRSLLKGEIMTGLERLGRAVKCVISGCYHMTAMKLNDLIVKIPCTNTKSLERRYVYHLLKLCGDCYVVALMLDDEKFIAETGEYLSWAIDIWLKTMN